MRKFILILAGAFVLAGCSQNLLDNPESTASQGVESRSAGWSGSPVRLVYAQPFNYAVSGFSWDQVYVYAHIKNIGTPASRVVYFYYNNGGTWTQTAMTKVGDYGDHSTYSLTPSGSTKEFVLKFVSDAGTYWDNNGGANYKVASWSLPPGYQQGAVGGNVGMNQVNMTNYAYFTGTGWSTAPKATLKVNVEDMSYNKQVVVHYTFDNGATWHDASLSFQSAATTGGGNKVQTWGGDVYSPAGTSSSGTMQFAVKYRNVDTSTDYWDNNFAQNYSVSLVYGTTIQ